MQAHKNQSSRENEAPSSGTSLLASYEAPPPFLGWGTIPSSNGKMKDLVSKETMVPCRWGSKTRLFCCVRENACYLFHSSVFHSRGFYGVLHVLMRDAGSFQASAAVLDWHLASTISCRYPSDARRDEFDLKLLYNYCEFQKYKVMPMSVSRWSAKRVNQIQDIKQQNTSSALF